MSLSTALLYSALSHHKTLHNLNWPLLAKLTLPPQETLDLFGSVDVAHKWNPLCSVPVRLDHTESEILHVSKLALTSPVFFISDAIHWFKQFGLSCFEGWNGLFGAEQKSRCAWRVKCAVMSHALRERGEQRDLFKREALWMEINIQKRKLYCRLHPAWDVLHICVRFEF